MMINYADEIKSRVTMLDVCELYGIKVNSNHKAVCPFHNDAHASMHVYDGRRGWFCFTCGEGGDIISFAQKFFNLDFQGACARLNDDFRLGLPIGKQMTLRELREAERAARDRKKKIEAEKAEHELLLADYRLAFDRYAELDRLRTEYAPKRTHCVLTDYYVMAVQNISEAEDRLKQAEARLYDYEHKRAGNC